jgi:hypothetical protein
MAVTTRKFACPDQLCDAAADSLLSADVGRRGCRLAEKKRSSVGCVRAPNGSWRRLTPFELAWIDDLMRGGLCMAQWYDYGNIYIFKAL